MEAAARRVVAVDGCATAAGGGVEAAARHVAAVDGCATAAGGGATAAQGGLAVARPVLLP